MRTSSWLGGFLSLAVTAHALDARACGGCFTTIQGSGNKTVQVITDHRMVLALSSQQTTLWDQIRYSGQPENFIWVLPVPHGVPVRMGLGDNAFVNALADLSAPRVQANYTVFCPGVPSGAGGSRSVASGGGGGFGCGGSALSSIDYTPGASDDGGTSRYTGSEDLSVSANRDVVGPYSAEVVRGGASSFERWARENSYDIPRETLSAVRWYESLGTDFLVLRLAPEAGVEQMQPVRITYPGYLPTLPLRMIAAGVADKVGLDLMVIANTRMTVENFTTTTVPRERLVWDAFNNRSNYLAQFNRVLAEHRGRAWIVESNVRLTAPMMSEMNRGLDQVSFDAGLVEQVAGWSDAGAPFYDFDQILRPGVIPAEAFRSDPFVDRRMVFEHLGPNAILTRLRTELDRNALDRDLTLGPDDPLRFVTREIPVTRVTNPPLCPTVAGIVSPPSGGAGLPLRRASGLGLVALCFVALQLRRRARRDGAPSARALGVRPEALVPIGDELSAA